MDTVALLLLLGCAACTVSQSVVKNSSGGQRYTVELLAVVDKMAYDKWYDKFPEESGEERNQMTVKRISDFLSAVVVGVNNLYESVRKYGLILDVRLKKIHILKEDLWGEKDLRFGYNDQMPTDRAIKIFYNWSWRARDRLGSFDHAMLVTGYNLIHPEDPDKLTQGVAFKGVMCKYGSVSVVEQSFTYQMIDTAAHELGHSLGCDHDGEGNYCKDGLGHVMSSRTEINSTNRWSFSPCSIEAMKHNIAELNSINANCLVKTLTQPTSGQELGRLMDADEQCRMIFGPEAFFCRDFYTTSDKYAKMCYSMWCSANKRESHCKNYISSDGFACGNEKVCKRGNCVPSATPFSTPVSDTCPQGDQPGIVYQNLTCAEVASKEPWLCYKGFFQRKCCRACPSIREDGPENAGCEYGDKEGWCATDMKYPFDCYLNDKTCCKSCRQYRRDDKPGCEYGDQNIECQTELPLPIGCYENEALCCETCAKQKSPTNTDCPYGDKSTWCKDKLEVPNGCYLNQELCCGTCSSLANATMTERQQVMNETQTENSTSSLVVDRPLNWCLYGDRYPDWCQRETPYACYNATKREWCCQSCAKFEKAEDEGCEYGDRYENCNDLVYPYACYHQLNSKECCYICGQYLNVSRPDCPYGDHEAWCYKLNEKYTNDQWCHLDKENGHCCGTCLYNETAIPVFGSRVKKLGLPRPK